MGKGKAITVRNVIPMPREQVKVTLSKGVTHFRYLDCGETARR